MKTEKEIFELMLSRQDLFEFGICRWLININVNTLILDGEFNLMRNYLNQNLPNKTFPNRSGDPNLFCFEVDVIEPRIEWINEQIKKLK